MQAYGSNRGFDVGREVFLLPVVYLSRISTVKQETEGSTLFCIQ